VYAPEAEEQIVELHGYLANAASINIADRYIDSLIAYCESLTNFPERGARRNDIRPGLRITHHRGKTAIAFTGSPEFIKILGVFHGGRNYVAELG
jgi:toxin ParE1/3/4